MAIRDFGLPPREPEKPYLVPSRRPGRWKRVVLWIAGIILTLILVLAISVHALLHSASFHNYVLRTVEKNASESLNTQVRLQTFAVHLSNLGLDLYGLTVFGVGPGANAALLQVDRISLGVRIVSVLHRQWSLASVMVDHPVGHLIVNSNGRAIFHPRDAAAIPTLIYSTWRFVASCWSAARLTTMTARALSTPTFAI